MPDVIDYSDDDAKEAQEHLELSEDLELEKLILEWEKIGYIDLDSATIRDDFSVFLSQLLKKYKYKKALERVFERCMMFRFDEALKKGVIASFPQNVIGVLSGFETVNIPPSDIFLGNYIIQMRQYYDLFLEWQKV